MSGGDKDMTRHHLLFTLDIVEIKNLFPVYSIFKKPVNFCTS